LQALSLDLFDQKALAHPQLPLLPIEVVSSSFLKFRGTDLSSTVGYTDKLMHESTLGLNRRRTSVPCRSCQKSLISWLTSCLGAKHRGLTRHAFTYRYEPIRASVTDSEKDRAPPLRLPSVAVPGPDGHNIKGVPQASDVVLL